jgi:hypothetical protein
MHYIIKYNADTPNEQGQRVEYTDVHRVVDELSGRPGITGYVLSQMRTGKDRVYVASARGSEGRKQYGQGFVLERVQ